MAIELLSASLVTTLLIIISFFIISRLRTSHPLKAANKPAFPDRFPEPNLLGRILASALPDSVIFPQDAAAFKRSMNAYWAQQECDVMPACVVRPRTVEQLSTAVTILKQEYDERSKQAGTGKVEGLFAVRSGGHSPVAGSASLKGGVVIDLSHFCEVTPSEDGSSVVIGSGARWMDVSKVLDEKDLAVAGGRNSAVGVGGLTLGGKFRPFISIEQLPLLPTILQLQFRTLSLSSNSSTTPLRLELT